MLASFFCGFLVVFLLSIYSEHFWCDVMIADVLWFLCVIYLNAPVTYIGVIVFSTNKASLRKALSVRAKIFYSSKRPYLRCSLLLPFGSLEVEFSASLRVFIKNPSKFLITTSTTMSSEMRNRKRTSLRWNKSRHKCCDVIAHIMTRKDQTWKTFKNPYVSFGRWNHHWHSTHEEKHFEV